MGELEKLRNTDVGPGGGEELSVAELLALLFGLHWAAGALGKDKA